MRLWTVTHLADATGCRRHRVKRALERAGVEPLTRAGTTDVFGPMALDVVRRELAATRGRVIERRSVCDVEITGRAGRG